MKYAPKHIAIDWLNTIWETKLPYQSKYLACYLRKFMNSQHDMAWPSYSRMVEETGLSKMTISRYLKILEQEGWIIREKGNSKKNTIYTVCFPSSITEILPKTTNKLDQKKSESYPQVVSERDYVVSERDQGSIREVHELNKELNKELNNNSASRTASPSENSKCTENDKKIDFVKQEKKEPHPIESISNMFIKQGDRVRFNKVFGKQSENSLVYNKLVNCLQIKSDECSHELLSANSVIGYCKRSIATLYK